MERTVFTSGYLVNVFIYLFLFIRNSVTYYNANMVDIYKKKSRNFKARLLMCQSTELKKGRKGCKGVVILKCVTFPSVKLP